MGRKHQRVSPGDALPDVVIGGAPRSGTTFLCEVLAKHPQIYVAGRSFQSPRSA